MPKCEYSCICVECAVRREKNNDNSNYSQIEKRYVVTFSVALLGYIDAFVD